MFIVDLYYGIKYGKIISSAVRLDGKIYVGKKHSDCFVQREKGILRGAEQGFYTEKKKFVDRKVALKIARYYSQIHTKHNPPDELLSEDLI